MFSRNRLRLSPVWANVLFPTPSMLRNYFWFLGTAITVPLIFFGLLSAVHEPNIIAVAILIVSVMIYVGTDSGGASFRFSRLNLLGVLWRSVVLILAVAYISLIISRFSKDPPFIQSILVLSAFVSALGLDWKMDHKESADMGYMMTMHVILVLFVFYTLSR